MAVAVPRVGSTVATEVLLLAQEPPVEVSLKVSVLPTQRGAPPMMGLGNGTTLNGIVAMQPVCSA